MRPRLYLAGALHHGSQRQHLEMVASILQQRYDVYLPHRDGGLYFRMLRDGRNIDEAAEAIRDNDLNAIKGSDVLLAVAPKRFIDDSGVCFELGFASAVGVPVVVYGPDLDTSAALNPMLRASIFRIITHYEDLVGDVLDRPSANQQENRQ